MPSATQLIRRDHKKVEGLFDKFTQTKKAVGKKRICAQVIQELEIHTKLEEEIFYPAARGATKETDLLDEAEVEHAGAKDLIAQIQEAAEVDDMFDAKVKVLGEYIDHHVKEERNELFPKARAARKLDLVAMRDELAARKEELMAQMSVMA